MLSRKTRTLQKAFLAAFAETGSVKESAKAAGIERSTHYGWLEIDPPYPARFEKATDQAATALEDECTRRAKEGILQAEWYQGKAVGTKRVFSDGLAMFLLRGLKPAKYRQNVEVTGANGGAIAISLADVIRDRRAKRTEKT